MPIDPRVLLADEPLVGLGANGLLLLGSYAIARNGSRQPPGLARWLATAVVFWTGVTLGLEILSTLGAIAPLPMLIWAALFAAVGGVLWRRDLARVERGVDSLIPPLNWDARIALGITLATALPLLLMSLLMGVKVVSDGPIYHLYFAARWWKAGRLILVAAPFGENAATYFPANGDLWFTWLMTSWGGEQLAKVGQAPFLVLAGLAAAGCARLLGAGRAPTVVAACWFASSTPLFLFSFEPNVDTIFVAGYLLAAYFLVRYARASGGPRALALAGLSAGLALGTKSVAVVFVPPLIIVAFIMIIRRAPTMRIWVAEGAFLVLTMMLTSGFWYARNLWLTGNPTYPLEVRVLGRTLLAGWYGPDAMRFSPYYRPFSDWRALGDILLAVFDPRLVPVWLFAILASGFLSRSIPAENRRCVALFAIMAILNIALYWVFIPYRSQQRFMLQALGLAVIPLAITLDRLPWLRVIASVLVCIHLLTPQNWPLTGGDESIPWDLTRQIPNAVGAPMSLLPRIEIANRAGAGFPHSVVSLLCLLIVGIVFVGAWSSGIATGREKGRRRVFAILAAVGFAAVGLLDSWLIGVDFRQPFHPPFADFYRGWLALDSRAGRAGSRVAYAGTNIPYYLQGSGLRNEVRYINIDGHRDWLPHDYHRAARITGNGLWPNSRPGWDRINPDYAAWLENLAAERIQLLVVTRVNPAEGPHNVAEAENFPIERIWADAHPDRFEPLYGVVERDPWFRLYRVRARGGDQ